MSDYVDLLKHEIKALSKAAGSAELIVSMLRTLQVYCRLDEPQHDAVCLAAHYVPGVSAQFYDMPTTRIRDAIDSTVLPDCFYDLG